MLGRFAAWLCVVAVGIGASVPVGRAAPSNAHPQLATTVSIAHCMTLIERGGAPDDAECPGFLGGLLTQAANTCADAGGRLEATSPAQVWRVDVDGDGVDEFLFEYDGNVNCDGAPSVFSCGSLGCPLALYQKHQGTWRTIGFVDGTAPETLEVSPLSDASSSYRPLRSGCFEDPCDEITYYEWTGAQYDATRIDVRGFRVDLGASAHGLRALAGETDVLAVPQPGAAIVGRYGADTEVAIVGTAAGGDYYYVSPCNACASGFVRTSAVRTTP
jgi:hypothetical protein